MRTAPSVPAVECGARIATNVSNGKPIRPEVLPKKEARIKRSSNKSWVLVADGARALVLRNDGDAEYPNLKLVRTYGQENPATRKQGTDKPGRTHESVGSGRSAMEPTDWHQ